MSFREMARGVLALGILLSAPLLVTGLYRVSWAGDQAARMVSGRIKEVWTVLEVGDRDKEGGVVNVELHLGDLIRRWSYGSDREKWEVGFYARYVHRVDLDPAGGEPRVVVELRERPGETDIATRLKVRVSLTYGDGRTAEYTGDKFFRTGRGDDPLELQRVNASGPAERTQGSTERPAQAETVEGGPKAGLPPGTSGPVAGNGASSPVRPGDAPQAEPAKHPSDVKASEGVTEPGEGDTGTPGGGGSPDFLARLWRNGSTLKVAFIGGTDKMRRTFARVASEWVGPKGANLTLDFGADPAKDSASFYEYDARAKENEAGFDIRVGFDHPGTYSFIGVESRTAGPGESSLNIHQSLFEGAEDYVRGAILHEFGHALGLPHMFTASGSDVDFRWEDDPGYVPTKGELGQYVADSQGRKPGIYTLLSGPPNFWTKDLIDANFRPDPGLHLPLRPSPDTVMIFAFPESYFQAGKNSPWWRAQTRSTLSNYDRKLIRLMYPDTEPTGGAGGVRVKPPDAPESRPQSPSPNPAEVQWEDLPAKPAPSLLQGSNDPWIDWEDWKNRLDDRSRYTCLIRAYQPFFHPEMNRNYDAGEGIGTGFLIGPGLVLTCNHVVPDDRVAGACEVVFTFHGRDDAFRLASTAVVVGSPRDQLDFSLLVVAPRGARLPGILEGHYLLADSDRDRRTLYPHQINLTLLHHPGGRNRLQVDPRVGMLLKIQRDDGPRIRYDAATAGGSSGAPVLNDMGWLLALNHARDDRDEKLSVGIRIDAIIKHIRASLKDEFLLRDLSLAGTPSSRDKGE